MHRARWSANAAGSTGSPVRSSVSPSGTSRPVSPSETISGMPPVALATTGASHAIASTLTSPNGS